MSKSIRRRHSTPPQDLMTRLLDVPELMRVVPHLQPDVLHRVIRHCGLEDSGALLTMATPAQLRALADLDLWQAPRPGADEQLDVDRFGQRLEVLTESDADVAAGRIAVLDPALTIAGLAHYIRVFDPAALYELMPPSDDDVEPIRIVDGISCEIGGYLIVAKREDAWDAICSLLASLDAGHAACFHRLMEGCRRLSNAGFELDGLDDLLGASDQSLLDLAIHRDRRREQSGYVSPADARAFLAAARAVNAGGDAPSRHPLAASYFRDIEPIAPTAPPAPAPETPTIRTSDARLTGEPVDQPARDEESFSSTLTSVFNVLAQEGIVAPPRALLVGGDDGVRLPALHSYMVTAPDSASWRTDQELVYLANVVMAGSGRQDSPMTAQFAHDVVLATCNLGLESWPTRWNAPEDLLGPFQLGWAVLHAQVAMFTAKRPSAILGELQCPDVALRTDLATLRQQLTRAHEIGEPWRAIPALELLQSLDGIAWAALVGLLGELPLLHAGVMRSDRAVHSIRVSDVTPIARREQIDDIHAFVDTLPERLRP